MSSFVEAWRQIEAFLTSGIGGSAFTPLRLLTVIGLLSALVWITRRVTRWLIDRVLARRGFEIGVREAIGAILRYVVISLGALVILQAAGIDLTSLNVLVGAIGDPTASGEVWLPRPLAARSAGPTGRPTYGKRYPNHLPIPVRQ